MAALYVHVRTPTSVNRIGKSRKRERGSGKCVLRRAKAKNDPLPHIPWLDLPQTHGGFFSSKEIISLVCTLQSCTACVVPIVNYIPLLLCRRAEFIDICTSIPSLFQSTHKRPLCEYPPKLRVYLLYAMSSQLRPICIPSITFWPTLDDEIVIAAPHTQAQHLNLPID